MQGGAKRGTPSLGTAHASCRDGVRVGECALLNARPLAILEPFPAPERCLSSVPSPQGPMSPGLSRPMPPLAIRAYSATTALGRGLAAQRQALAQRRGGLRRNDFGPNAENGQPLDCWIGRVDGLEAEALPAEFAPWECRNNRLAWLALQQDGLLDAVAAVRRRHGADRVALVIGTS